METLSDQSPFSRQSREQDDGRYVSGNLVLWLAVLAVLVGLNFASWSFCMWVFGQPEHPMNYRLLTKLERLDPIHGFTPVTAPRGKFVSAKDLYAQVYPFSDTELRAYNGILKRSYLKNYVELENVTFLSGDFTVLSVRAMGEERQAPLRAHLPGGGEAREEVCGAQLHPQGQLLDRDARIRDLDHVCGVGSLALQQQRGAALHFSVAIHQKIIL
jgi:hypothetical protein